MRNKKIRARANVESYSLDLVNCFERSFGLCVNMTQKKYSDLLFMMNDFIRCYGIPYKEFETFEREAYLCEQIFEIECKKRFVNNDLKSCIKESLREDHLVLAPGNLKKLFYSDQYMEIDWPHLFFVTGFNEDKNLFYLLDSTQLKSNDPKEKEFVIDQDYFIKVFDGYFNAFPSNSLPYVFSIDFSRLPNKIELVIKKCYELILSRYMNDMTYQEIRIMNQVESINSSLNSVFNMPKRKKFFYEILWKTFIDFHLMEKEQSDYLNNLLDILIDKWQIYINSFYKNMLQNLPQTNFSLLEEIIELEEEIRLINQKKLTKYIEDSTKTNFEIMESDSENILENNSDEIIKKDGNNFIFTFSGDKLYNTWFDDESPKICCGIEDSIDFSTTVTVLENDYRADFVAGIYLRTATDLFFFGIDSCRRINIDKTKKVNSVEHIVGNFSSISLRVYFTAGICSFYVVQENELILLHKELLSKQRIEVGLACKTYTEPHPLKIYFENKK